MRLGAMEMGMAGVGLFGFLIQAALIVVQLYAMYLFIKAAKIYIKNNENFDDTIKKEEIDKNNENNTI